MAMYNGKFVFCKHKDRTTLESPGGHREKGENIDYSASRELKEETGALDFKLIKICPYSYESETNKAYGMFYFADIKTFERELHYEIEKIIITDDPCQQWTFKDIEPKLIEEAKSRGLIK